MKKIDVAVLGATGKVGLEYLEMLESHPWFRVVAVTGNSKVGLKMGDVAPDLPNEIGFFGSKRIRIPPKLRQISCFPRSPLRLQKKQSQSLQKLDSK